MRTSVKNLILLICFGLFLLSGCSHRNVNGSVQTDTETVAISSSEKDTATPPSAEESEEIEYDSFDDFEEEFEAQSIHVADPLYPFNYTMYHFNDKFYFWILKPVSKGYKAIVPTPARRGVKNFFRNLATPVRLTSCLLQGKGRAAGNEFLGFVVNTTIGVAGFGDPAQKKFNLKLSDEDLGQTFGVYGIGNGFYIVWPFLGPSTLRDTVGMVSGSLLNPVTYIESPGSFGVTALNMINEASFKIGDYETIKNSAVKPYEAFRNAYLQYRKAKIKE